MPKRNKSSKLTEVAAKGGRARSRSLSSADRKAIARNAAERRWMSAEDRPLSIATLQAMSEDELRKQVLIPLFRKMGYFDVTDYHGGSLEQGKDIVMWQRTDFGRRNIAVVVKAKKISGKASGNNSAAEVATQIRQCFGRPFHDRESTDELPVHECIVVCPYELTTEARQSIASILGDSTRRNVGYLHGQSLWEKVREHFGARAALAQLTKIGRVLENENPNYRMIAKTSGAQVEVEVEPKHPDSLSKEPLEISGQFRFPDDEAGRSALSELNRHLERGTPVTIDGGYINRLKLPDFLAQVMGGEVSSIKITPVPSKDTFRFNLEAANRQGDHIIVGDLEFRCIRSGSKEITFSADRSPYKIQIILDSGETPSICVKINFGLESVNVAEALEAVEFHRILSGGTLTLRDSSTRLLVAKTEVRINRAAAWYDETLVDLLRNLVAIQERTSTSITVPTVDITREQLNEIRGIAKGVSDGVVPIRSRNVYLTIGRQGVEQILSESLGASFRLAVLGEATFQLGEQKIQLGKVAKLIPNATITPSERKRLQVELQKDSLQKYKVQVDCSKSQSQAIYLKFLPFEERERYRAILPELSEDSDG